MVKLSDFIFVICGSITLLCLCCLFIDKFVITRFRDRLNTVAIEPDIEEPDIEEPYVEEVRGCNFV